MENSTKKKANTAKKKKKNNELKNKEANKETIYFDEEIEFEECETVVEKNKNESKKEKANDKGNETKTLKKQNTSLKKKEKEKGEREKKEEGEGEGEGEEKEKQEEEEKKDESIKKEDKEESDTGNGNTKKSKEKKKKEKKKGNKKEEEKKDVEEENKEEKEIKPEDTKAVEKEWEPEEEKEKLNDHVKEILKKGSLNTDVLSPKKNKNASENSKKNSTKIQKTSSKIDITEEDNEEIIKWLQFLPNVNTEIENIVKQQLPFYNILNNPKRIKKIKNIVYTEKEDDEALVAMDNSASIFNSVKLSNKEKYIIRFLSEGVNCTLSELVELLFYVLNNRKLKWNDFPIKLVVSGKMENNETKRKISKQENKGGETSDDFYFTSSSKNDEIGFKSISTNHSLGEKENSLTSQKEEEQEDDKREETGKKCTSIDRGGELDEHKNNFDFFSDDEDSEEDSDEEKTSESNRGENDRQRVDEEEEKKTFIYVSKEDLLTSIPLLLSRKPLGENMKQVTISKNENNEDECLWVWENDNYEIFPNYYKEVFKYYREIRYNISKIYKTLIKFKNSIISRDLSNVIKLQDYLNELKKKQFLECEKRSKKILNEKKKIIKKKMELKKQEEKKKKIEEEKKKKIEEAAKLLEEKKNYTLVKSDSTVTQSKSDDKKAKQQNLMMSWLTVKKSNTVSNTVLQEPEIEKVTKYPIVDIIFFQDVVKDEIVIAQNDLPIFKSYKPNKNFSTLFTTESNTDKETLLTNYISFCKVHKKSFATFFEKYAENREFFEEIPSVDNIDGFKITPQIEKNVRSKLWEDNEFFLKLKESDYIRSFLFYDSSWTRPFMTLLVHKILNDHLNVLPFYYHDDMEYENDTNEEYYEKFETIDLTTENEENESESEASSQDMFIVPDDELNRDIDDLIPMSSPVSTDIHFFSLFDWKWNFEGSDKKNYSIIDKNVWKEFNLKYKENIYGCLYSTWGVENNPFKFMTDRKSLNNTLDNYQIKQLIKHSHGKITKKDVLVDQFKIKNDHVTKADMERKFKIYLKYVKCEDNRKKWMASEEGVQLFKNEELLSRIYEKRKRKLDQISKQIEEAKRQKRAHKENIRREEKLKEKEKEKLKQELENKENIEIEEILKSEQLEKGESSKKDHMEIGENINESAGEITQEEKEKLEKEENEKEYKEKNDVATNLIINNDINLKGKNKKLEKSKSKKIKSVETIKCTKNTENDNETISATESLPNDDNSENNYNIDISISSSVDKLKGKKIIKKEEGKERKEKKKNENKNMKKETKSKREKKEKDEKVQQEEKEKEKEKEREEEEIEIDEKEEQEEEEEIDEKEEQEEKVTTAEE